MNCHKDAHEQKYKSEFDLKTIINKMGKLMLI